MNENSDIDNSTDERTVDLEWAIRNQHNQLHCRFQITYNQLFFTGLENPLTASFGQDHYEMSCKLVNMLTAKKHMGFSYSYKDVRRSRKLLETKPLTIGTKFESHRRKIFTVRPSLRICYHRS